MASILEMLTRQAVPSRRQIAGGMEGPMPMATPSRQQIDPNAVPPVTKFQDIRLTTLPDDPAEDTPEQRAQRVRIETEVRRQRGESVPGMAAPERTPFGNIFPEASDLLDSIGGAINKPATFLDTMRREVLPAAGLRPSSVVEPPPPAEPPAAQSLLQRFSEGVRPSRGELQMLPWQRAGELGQQAANAVELVDPESGSPFEVASVPYRGVAGATRAAREAAATAGRAPQGATAVQNAINARAAAQARGTGPEMLSQIRAGADDTATTVGQGLQRTETPGTRLRAGDADAAREMGQRSGDSRKLAGLEHAAERGELGAGDLPQKLIQAGRELAPNEPMPDIEVFRRAAAMTPEEIAALKPGQKIDTPQLLRVRAEINKRTDDIRAIESEISAAGDAMDPDASLLANTKLAGLLEDGARLAGVADPQISEAGRMLRMQRKIMETALSDPANADPSLFLRMAERNRGGPLNPQEQADILGLLRQLRSTAATDSTFDDAKAELAKKITEVESSWLDAIMGIRKAGMLSAPRTVVVGGIGNTLFQAEETIAHPIASLIDKGLSVATGQRTIAGSGLGGAAQGLRTGIANVGDIVKYGATREQISRFDVANEIKLAQRLSDGKVARGFDAMLNMPFRAQSAIDQPFRQAAAFRELASMSNAEALNMVKRGIIRPDQVAETAETLARNPSLVMQGNALLAGELSATEARLLRDARAAGAEGVFANNNIIASKINSTKRALQNSKSAGARAAGYGAELFFPFVTTPTNIVSRVLDLSGITAGFETAATVGRASRQMFRGAKPNTSYSRSIVEAALSPEQQKTLAKAFSRGATGLGLMWMGSAMAEKGQIIGMGPADPGQQRAYKAALDIMGVEAGSIISADGTYRRIADFSPVANMLIIGATNNQRQAQTAMQQLGGGASASLATLQEAPLFQGFQNISTIQRDLEAGAQNALARQGGNIAASFVPSVVAQYAREQDDRLLRDSRVLPSQSPLEAFMGPVQERLPAIEGITDGRQALPPRRDGFGRARRVGGSAESTGLLGSQAMNPMRPVKAAEVDPVGQFLLELAVSKGLSTVTPRKGEPRTTYEMRQIHVGQAVHDAVVDTVTRADWATLPPAKKRVRMENTILKARRKALGDFPTK